MSQFPEAAKLDRQALRAKKNPDAINPVRSSGSPIQPIAVRTGKNANYGVKSGVRELALLSDIAKNLPHGDPADLLNSRLDSFSILTRLAFRYIV